MYTMPHFEVDTDMLTKFKDNVVSEKEEAYALIEANGVPRTILGSNPQFHAWLVARGVDPAVMISDKTGKVSMSKANKKFLDLTKGSDFLLAKAIEARLMSKSTLKESRSQRFLDVARLTGGKFPVPLAYCGAMQTNRLSGCVVGDTKITTLTLDNRIVCKLIVDVLLTDLVWDGEEFVSHEGVKFSGFREVITHDGITATPEHVVFTVENDEVSLQTAMSRRSKLKSGCDPDPV
jgi:hypothetical protein